MGETRVDLLHLLEDLRDAYPGSLEESILTEIVANCLDSGAGRIALAADPAEATLTVIDDGSGMKRRELARYHDIAASGKSRGEGIGFAGVGIKLGLLASEEVLTETRRGKSHFATRWYLASRHRAPWKWVPPPGLVGERGTGVRLKLHNPLSPLLDPGFLEGTVRAHFQPLLDSAFRDVLAAHYPAGVVLSINGRRIENETWDATQRADVVVRLARKRKPSAAGYLVRDAAPLPEERQGVAISTFGKVIKRGWEWLGLTPGNPEQVGGLIEAPGLSECLTLNKTDFLRSGSKGAIYLAYRKAIQQAVARELAVWGDAPEEGEKKIARARPLERDLETVLVDLAEEFPLLESLVTRRPGGQRKLPIGKPGAESPLFVATAVGSVAPPAAPGQEVSGEVPEERSTVEGEPPAPPQPTVGEIPFPRGRGPRRPVRYGLTIRFEKRPDDTELGRLVESTIWVNEAHPAYLRAAASRSEGYHIALAAAMALASVAVDPSAQHAFVTAFFTRWGEALRRAARRRRRKK